MALRNVRLTLEEIQQQKKEAYTKFCDATPMLSRMYYKDFEYWKARERHFLLRGHDNVAR